MLFHDDDLSDPDFLATFLAVAFLTAQSTSRS